MTSREPGTEQRLRKGPPARAVIPRDQVLDAATDLVLEVGISRLTMADLARRAQVSRATLYRRWSGVEGIVADLFIRELRGLLVAAMRSASGNDARSILVSATVAVVRLARPLPLLRRVIEVDPGFLMPYLVQRRGRSTTDQLALIEDLVRDGQADRSIRRGDPALLSAAVALNAWAFVLTGPVFIGVNDSADVGAELERLDDELAHLLDVYLRP